MNGSQQAGNFLSAKRFRQPARPFGGNAQVKVRLVQDVPMKKTNPGEYLVAGTEGQFSFGNQVVEVTADLFDAEFVGREAVMGGQVRYGPDVRFNRSRGLAT